MRKEIMLIDDDEDEYLILSEALERTNAKFGCLYQNDIELALKQLADNKPYCIFLDMNMPKTNGLECVAKIINQLKNTDIPIIIYSTSVTPDLYCKAIAAGALGCIQKPATIARLTTVLNDFLPQLFMIVNKPKPPLFNTTAANKNTADCRNGKGSYLYLDKLIYNPPLG